jgi:hypothetical protein
MKMKTKSELAFVVLIVFVVLSCLPTSVLSANSVFSYELLDHPSGSIHYSLNVAVSESLLEYYAEKGHMLISTNDFATFVTPYALKPIADCLRGIYSNDEDFANGVLMIVHQIPYEETTPSKYPVETIVANKGDCDLFSYIAASIMKAGGLNVALFYYESADHMNVGVSLSHEPQYARGDINHVLHDGTKYYMAECTGGDWQEGWRVGECPDDLQNATVQVITLENCEQSAPGQVSASYKALAISAASLDVSSTFLIQGTAVTLTGMLSPHLQNNTITIFIKANGLPWSELCMVSTDSSGRFAYVWRADVSGICYLRASWSGNGDYASADSATRTVTVLPWFFIALLGLTVVLVSVGTVVFLMSRHNGSEVSEPPPPEIPSLHEKL